MSKSTTKKLDVKSLQKQVNDLTESLQRERADSHNIRRHHDEQISGIKDLVKASVVRELLPVIDNFDRSLSHIPKDLKGNDFTKGIQVIVKQFEKTLQDLGVERIKTVAEEFDPLIHQAVSVEEGKGSKEIISEELQSGYKIGNDVIRPAMVKVKKG